MFDLPVPCARSQRAGHRRRPAGCPPCVLRKRPPAATRTTMRTPRRRAPPAPPAPAPAPAPRRTAAPAAAARGRGRPPLQRRPPAEVPGAAGTAWTCCWSWTRVCSRRQARPACCPVVVPGRAETVPLAGWLVRPPQVTRCREADLPRSGPSGSSVRVRHSWPYVLAG